MLSTILGLVCVLYGATTGHSAAYDRVVTCVKQASEKIAELDAKIKAQPDHKRKIADYYEKVLRPCIAKPFDSADGSSATILDYFRAYYWQIGVMQAKTNVFTDLDLDDLEEVVLESEIMDRENLTNIDSDPPAPCVGDAYLKCADTPGVYLWEHHSNEFSLLLFFLECFSGEAKTCDKPMMTHLVELVKVFEYHLIRNLSLLVRLLEEAKTNQSDEEV